MPDPAVATAPRPSARSPCGRLLRTWVTASELHTHCNRHSLYVYLAAVHGYSLLSSEPIQAQEVEWLMSRFSAVLDHGTLVVRWDGGEAVLADATGDLASMPPTVVELATRALGAPPEWQASLMVFGRDNQQVAEQIATAFGQYWPIVLDDDSAEPPRRIGNFSG